MDYYLDLAEQQAARFIEFQKANKQNNRMQNRIAFFAQAYEIHISHSICTGIARMRNHPATKKP